MIKFPIKFINGNLIKNVADEWFAYYRLEPYDYSFRSPEEKLKFFGGLREVVGQTMEGNVHMLVISSETSMELKQEKSKALVQGDLEEIALQTIDMQSEVLIDGIVSEQLIEELENEDKDLPYYIGETEIDYQYYIGFKLVPPKATGIKAIVNETLDFFKDVFNGISSTLMNDYISVSNNELERYSRMERLVFSKISTDFEFQRVKPKDIGYIVEHIHGKTGIAYEDYYYHLPHENAEEHKILKSYDLLKLSDCILSEYPRHIKYSVGNDDVYCAYLTVKEIINDLEFPNSEIIYYQQHFDFPVDTSINLKVIENRKALSTIRNRKKMLDDIDEHAARSGNDTNGDVLESLEVINELEADLAVTKDSMYEMSYLLRISAPTEEELEQRVTAVKDYYDKTSIKLVCPVGDMLNFHHEFIPSSPRTNTIINRVKSDFPACLGFGASQVLGENEGIAVGYTKYGGKYVYLQPWRAAQGVNGAITNSSSIAFVGATGFGKSFNVNMLLYFCILFGSKAVILDPKSERGKWKEKFPDIAHEINIMNLTADDENRGILDPFIIMPNLKDAESLSMDVLSFLLGIGIQDEKFPVLKKAISAVAKLPQRGLLFVVDELRKEENSQAQALANHIESFVDSGLGSLLFSYGVTHNKIDFDSKINIIQIAGLMLPNENVDPKDYTILQALSVALMMITSMLSLKFIHSEPNIFKIVLIDEAWSILKIAQGKELSDRLIREGRSMNAAIWLCTQNAKDIEDEVIRNNLGMIFLFHALGNAEVSNYLEILGLDTEDEGNREKIEKLKVGECVMRDIYGHVNVIKFEYLLLMFKHGFNTSPTRKTNKRGD